MGKTPKLVTLDEIRDAQEQIRKVVHRTPFQYSNTFSLLTGSSVYLKYENLQKAGSFKIRGAYNRISRLAEKERKHGIAAFSAGNHAQGVALAGRLLKIPTVVFMPEGTPLTKVQATRGYGAEVTLAGESFDEAYRNLEKWRKKHPAFLVHPFDDRYVIAGQGTIGLEILEDEPELDVVLVPIGGGGLISGIATAVKALRPTIRVVGVQAEAASAMYQSWIQKRVIHTRQAATLADGIAVKRPSPLTWAHVQERVDEIVTVSDQEIAHSILLLLERARVVVEGAGAAALAAVLRRKVQAAGQKVAVILSGGNIDSLVLSKMIQKRLVDEGRIIRFSLTIPDVPGALARLLELVASCRANLLDVLHDRMSSHIALGKTGVEVTLEARGFDHVREIEEVLAREGYEVQRHI